MLRKNRHIISLVLALHILLSSVGVALHTRSCQMPEMGKSISFFVPDNDACCDKKSAQDCNHSPKSHIPVNPCCEFASDFYKTDFSSPLYAGLVLDFQVLSAVIELPFSYQPIFSFDLLQIKYSFYTDTSPPTSGRQILLQKRTLLI